MNRWICTAVMLAGFLLAGCNDGADARYGANGEPEAVVTLVGKAHPQIADLPVPEGFKLDESKSWSRYKPEPREVLHYYKGRADKFAVGRFYTAQMPRHGWKLGTDRFDGGTITLTFTNEKERAQVEISDGGIFNPIVIFAQIYPE